MLVRLEAARSVAYHAAEALAAGDADEIAVAAPMAASLCAEVACQLTGDNIQVHGGIGFTWEHDAHLAFKRAEATRHLFGSPEAYRALLADQLELRPG
jgi:alkylation response protein AidB-like acyl-CoA dehydrogenase